MGILKDIEKVAGDIEHEVEKLGEDVEKELEKAADDIKKGVEKIADFVKEGFDDTEKALLDKLVSDSKSQYASEITQFKNLVSGVIKAMDKNAVAADLVKAFDPKDPDPSGLQVVLGNVTSDTFRSAFDLLEKSGFETVSVGASGELDLVVGAAGAGSMGYKFENHDTRLLLDFSVSAGEEEGGDVAVFGGMWRRAPKHLQGGFLAVVAEVDLVGGLGVSFFFEASLKPTLLGITVSVLTGEEEELSIDPGFTLAIRAT